MTFAFIFNSVYVLDFSKSRIKFNNLRLFGGNIMPKKCKSFLFIVLCSFFSILHLSSFSSELVKVNLDEDHAMDLMFGIIDVINENQETSFTLSEAIEPNITIQEKKDGSSFHIDFVFSVDTNLYAPASFEGRMQALVHLNPDGTVSRYENAKVTNIDGTTGTYTSFISRYIDDKTVRSLSDLIRKTKVSLKDEL